ncbi:hypothetical protein X975_06961, partial [Stegodyphus mimosarum]
MELAVSVPKTTSPSQLTSTTAGYSENAMFIGLLQATVYSLFLSAGPKKASG